MDNIYKLLGAEFIEKECYKTNYKNYIYRISPLFINWDVSSVS